MAMELMMDHVGGGDSLASRTRLEDEALKDEATAGVKAVEDFLRLLSQTKLQNQQQQQSSSLTNSTESEINAASGVAVNHFEKMMSLMGPQSRKGHARFRRGPVTPTPPSPVPVPSTPAVQATKDHDQPNNQQASALKAYCPPPPLPPPPPPPVNRCLPPLPQNHQPKSVAAPVVVTKSGSSLAGQNESLHHPSFSSVIPFLRPSVSSAGKPPLPSSALKRRCHSLDAAPLRCRSSSGRCHCSKKRKSKITGILKALAVGEKAADIPPDNFQWRKYGQKPIKGSPYPRGYYKCSTLKGCPARKHVERDPEDPMMMIITYENDHDHFSNDADDMHASIVLESTNPTAQIEVMLK
ncbi:WRKY domain-containing protein/Plant_zn_clust domain-containing protein [Cephalotus follicularis]|uniref:WRKY domain-containing protein/Plant_zn_clust domain-containing protein n=1 Tax=Cephalotus follicularis TaxID=3775 RepID=A0A1Q3CM58_CEPFO|nr:WRKY domain-containing protein/Plant_zn_clust domain-containing protein [Cephalotus follicularis]